MLPCSIFDVVLITVLRKIFRGVACYHYTDSYIASQIIIASDVNPLENFFLVVFVILQSVISKGVTLGLKGSICE